MQRWACVATLAVLFTLLAFPGFAFQNEPDGFRGIKWGELFVDRKDLDPVRMPPYDDTEVEMRMKLAPEPPLGDVELFQVRYEFWRGKFIGAEAGIRSQSDFRKVKIICEERFGPPIQTFTYPERNRWKGEKTTVTLGLSDTGKIGVLKISSTQLRDEQYKSWQERSRKAGEKGF